MRVNFLTTSNKNNGYGMTREYFNKYLPKHGVYLDHPKQGNEFTLILHTPPAVQYVGSGKIILYTMIEGDTLPESWKPHLAKADHIVVPTTFVQSAFARAGFDSTVIPLGYDSEVFKPVSRTTNNVYTFLHYEAFQDRKGWQDLLDAWLISGLAELNNECQLILKTVKPWKEIATRLEDTFIPPNVKLIIGELPHHAMFDLLTTVDCFVFPSHGEGFSLPPLEAMATGLPVVISVGHSHLDYYSEKYMYGVDALIKIPAKYENWENQGNFVRCSVDELAAKLRYIYNNKEEALKKGLSSVELAAQYDYDISMKKLADYIKAL